MKFRIIDVPIDSETQYLLQVNHGFRWENCSDFLYLDKVICRSFIELYIAWLNHSGNKQDK